MNVLRAAVAAVLVVIALAAGEPAGAAPAGAEEVYTALGVNTVPADYVVMVDVSGSMNGPRYAQVKRSLGEFLAALAPDDQVTFVPFADRPRPLKTRPAGRSAAQLVNQLPAAATGTSTDIGAALEASVTILSRPNAPAVASVVLLTDGLHQPPAGSPYPYTSGYQWNVLAKRAHDLKKTSLSAFAVPLSATTGASLLAKVYPGAQTLRISGIDRLTTALDQPKQAARAAKARALLGVDAGQRVRVAWPAGSLGAGEQTVPVRLTSTMSHVPLTVEDLAVTTTNSAVRVSVPATPVALPPGGSATVKVTVDWSAGPRRLAPFATVHGAAPLTLTARIDSPWSPVLTGDLKMSLDPALSGAGHDARLSAQRGSVVWWAAALVLLAALALVARWGRERRLRPDLSGNLLVRNGEKPERVVALSGRRLALTAGSAGISGNGTVTASRGSLGSSGVELRITYSPDGSDDHRESRDVPPGRTVNIGGVRFTWRAPAPKAGTR